MPERCWQSRRTAPPRSPRRAPASLPRSISGADYRSRDVSKCCKPQALATHAHEVAAYTASKGHRMDRKRSHPAAEAVAVLEAQHGRLGQRRVPGLHVVLPPRLDQVQRHPPADDRHWRIAPPTSQLPTSCLACCGTTSVHKGRDRFCQMCPASEGICCGAGCTQSLRTSVQL